MILTDGRQDDDGVLQLANSGRLGGRGEGVGSAYI